MFGIEIIEVGIGLVFMYLAISLICSGIVEAGVKVSKLRAKHLKTALGKLLDDPNHNGFVKQLYEHHLIKSPLEDKIGEPEYMAAQKFSAAVFDILATGSTDDDRYQAIKARIELMNDSAVKTRLLKILESSAEELETMRDKVETWFNDNMEAVTKWYRKRMRTFVSFVGIAIVTILNADTIHVAKNLWTDNDMRQATVSAAKSYSASLEQRMADVPADSAALTFGETISQIESDINQTKVLPIGWVAKDIPGGAGFDGDPILFWLMKVLGLLLTVGAVSLGAPYWYGMLKSLLNLRFGSGGSGDEASKGDSQPVNVTINNEVPKTETSSAGSTLDTPTLEDTGEAGL